MADGCGLPTVNSLQTCRSCCVRQPWPQQAPNVPWGGWDRVAPRLPVRRQCRCRARPAAPERFPARPVRGCRFQGPAAHTRWRGRRGKESWKCISTTSCLLLPSDVRCSTKCCAEPNAGPARRQRRLPDAAAAQRHVSQATEDPPENEDRLALITTTRRCKSLSNEPGGRNSTNGPAVTD